MKTLLTILTLFTLSLGKGFSQNLELKIKVFAQEDSTQLTGAVIRLMPGESSFITGRDGTVTLTLNSSHAYLLVSYVGYSDYRLELTSVRTKELSLFLKPLINQLQDVDINTGYSPQKKGNLTGSAFGVDNALINRTVSSSVLDRLKDIVPGLIFNRTGNAAATPITIRGQSTINANTQPLIILDNFPFNGDLSSINPNDIESISILKDAAASAIWGARSGNGVIVLTSKKGVASASKISFTLNTELGEKPDLNYRPRLSSADFIEVEKLLFSRGYYNALENSATKTPLTPIVELLIAKRDGKLGASEADSRIEALKNYDVRDEYSKLMSRPALTSRAALSLSGGTAISNYYLGAGYDKSLMNDKGNSNSRTSLNFRNNYSLFKGKLDAEFLLRYSKSGRTQNNPGYSSLSMATGTAIYPYARLLDNSGNAAVVTKDIRSTFLDGVSGAYLDWRYRPLEEILLSDNSSKTINYSGQLNLRYKIVKGLDVSALYQYAVEDYASEQLQGVSSYYARNLINSFTKINPDNSISRPVPLGGILDFSNREQISQNYRAQINYATRFSGHQIRLFSGAEVSDAKTLGRSSRFYGYDSEHAISTPVDYRVTYPSSYITSSTNNLIPNRDVSSGLIDRFVSYYLSGNYSYLGRYFFNANIRKDESNILGVSTNLRGVPLWSAGLAWNLSDESFYDKTRLPELKFRATFGYNGNLDRSTSAYTTASYQPSAVETRLPFAQIVNPPNPELRWEKIATLNLGLDFKFFKGKLSGSFDYFTKKGSDIIGESPFAPSSGITTFYGNVANTKTTGIDLIVNGNLSSGSFSWQGTFIYNYSRELVTRYSQKAGANNYVLTQGVPREGYPLYSIYYYDFAGLDSQTGDALGYLNGVLSKDYTRILASYNATNLPYAGSSRPVHFGSLRNTFSYGKLSLSAIIAYRAGYYVKRPVINYGEILTGKSGHAEYTMRWKSPGDELITNVPSLPAALNSNRDSFYQHSSVAILKGDHIRLQDIRLDYRLSGYAVLKKLGITDASVYLYGQNLGLLWKANQYRLDPDYISSQPLRSVAFGLQLTL